MNSWLAIYRFELKRVFSSGRMFWWFVVAAFPPTVIFLLSRFGDIPKQATPEQLNLVFTAVLYFLAPSVSCMLGALLMSAPAIANELEQHSWVYLATRPNGLFHLVLGKYSVSVTWAGSATIVGVIVSAFVGPYTAPLATIWQMSLLAFLSAMAYSALYLMIGTVFHARAMVFCVAYTAGVELFLGLLPAVINRLTMQFRLRTMLFNWVELPASAPRDMREGWNNMMKLVASDEGQGMQILWLVSFSAVFICLALVCVQVREFTTARESEL